MKNNETYETIRQQYGDRLEKYNTQKKTLDEKMERLKKRQEKNQYPHWTKYFLKPVIDQLVPLTPEIQWKDTKELHVFGARCECFVSGKTKDGKTVGITFTHDSQNVLHYMTHERKNRFLIGSDFYDFNIVRAPVENIETLVNYIRRQSIPLNDQYPFITEGARLRCTVEYHQGEYTVKKVRYCDCDDKIYENTEIVITDGKNDMVVFPEELQPSSQNHSTQWR